MTSSSEVRISATATHTSGDRRHRFGPFSELAAIVRDVSHHWVLLYYLTLRDVRIRYKQAVMGFGWALLMPMVVVAAGLVVQLVLASGQGQSVTGKTIAATAVKALPWAFFVGAIQFAVNSLTSNSNLVSKVFFPREVLPMASVFAQGFDTIIGAVTLIVPLLLLGVRPSPGLFWVPVIALLLLGFTTAASIFLSCANLFFRDIKYIVQLALTFGIFFNPVLFQPEMLGQRGANVLMLNPLAVILEGFYLAVVEGHNLLERFVVSTAKDGLVVVWEPWFLGYTAVVTVLGLAGAVLMFRRLQFLFAEYI